MPNFINSLYLKPAEGARVRDPLTKDLLPEAGRAVEDSSYWRRRLESGEVLLSDPPGRETGNKTTKKEDVK